MRPHEIYSEIELGRIFRCILFLFHLWQFVHQAELPKRNSDGREKVMVFLLLRSALVVSVGYGWAMIFRCDSFLFQRFVPVTGILQIHKLFSLFDTREIQPYPCNNFNGISLPKTFSVESTNLSVGFFPRVAISGHCFFEIISML